MTDTTREHFADLIRRAIGAPYGRALVGTRTGDRVPFTQDHLDHLNACDRANDTSLYSDPDVAGQFSLASDGAIVSLDMGLGRAVFTAHSDGVSTWVAVHADGWGTYPAPTRTYEEVGQRDTNLTVLDDVVLSIYVLIGAPFDLATAP